ncbi:sugar transferase [Salinigranum salinum]|uniref:sugar transferase n=1 Tax=Salinigranum salinum TaxID=1364937 RepID=UPI00126114D2|nr:sugar transferase [Salinigranum salinum]
MPTGWRYRFASAAGVTVLTTGAVAVANHPQVQHLLVSLPIVSRLPATTLSNGDLSLAITTTLFVVLGACVPLFKPQPRRRLDVLSVAEKRVFLAVVALAAIGYFDYTYRLPRTTLLLLGGFLAILIPVWFVAIRGRPEGGAGRVVIVGDDPETIEDVLDTLDVPVIGYISPPPPRTRDRDRLPPIGAPDGGRVIGSSGLSNLECLGGLSRLVEVFVTYDVDTAVLAFSEPDRAEFFGTLDTCYEYGVTAKVHREHADTVLTSDTEADDLVDVDLEPWDWQDYVLKRAFDVVFASVGLVVLAPVMVLVAVAVKLDSEGPVLYSQERTATFGDTFTVYKFRSMVANAEAQTGATVSDEDAGGVDPRVTRVGRVIRQTHLDELPQLWSILVGDMSAVGPRPERPELDLDMQSDANSWRRRWFVNPGLTGLAQINNVTGAQPKEKLRHDVTYIRNQSFWFDLKVLVRQLWMVLVDAVRFVR